MISPKDELTALLTLEGIEGIGRKKAKQLYDYTGNALDIFRSHKDLDKQIPGVTKDLLEALDDPGSLLRAEKEISYAEEHGIRYLTIEDNDYPVRMRDCCDAPLVLFTLGHADLNTKHILGVVGTRNATPYGKSLTDTFIKEIKQLCPDVLILSGLAYGIDVTAHKSCLEHGVKTGAVLAHGLDRIYPETHRNVASALVNDGILITEYTSGTFPLKQNFISRNRIIAGMSDAVIVIESASKGGSLTTAEMAEGYFRQCFAFPGNVGNAFSTGCNELIRDNKAGLITSAEDLINFMGWEKAHKKPVQKVLFEELDNNSANVLKALQNKAEGVQLNILAASTGIPVGKLTALLFELEMKDLVKSYPGSIFKLA